MKMKSIVPANLLISAISIATSSAFHTSGRPFLGGTNRNAALREFDHGRISRSSLSLFQDFDNDEGSFMLSEADRRRMEELYERYVQMYTYFYIGNLGH